MLRTVIAAAFKAKGRRSMSKSELTYVLSFDFKWFSHDKSKQVVELAIKKGLLVEENDSVRPAFDVSSVEIPIDFKPDLSRLNSSSVFDEIVDEISAKTGKDVSEVIAEINALQERLGNLVDAEVTALLVAKRCGVDISDYIDEVERDLFSA
ncbi:DUF2240 family protein [Archaeoglobus veneficus]|uniref:DUF2240 family protein n=1 Tax=Archaeoglobus veneficus (strain DSM 11195 / SNP6) TaxID=693661 RepID=F2KQI2_ARCVS|nr:DUF2240 family protein [Archaeoglobus veneficus]AEA47715.1 Protein of unknown function DUF2240 [Archaeoglobus veneficus SNP6]